MRTDGASLTFRCRGRMSLLILRAAGECAQVEWGIIDLGNRLLRGYLLGARDLMEAPPQVGGVSRRALSRS
jgi:hypothetical protein